MIKEPSGNAREHASSWWSLSPAVANALPAGYAMAPLEEADFDNGMWAAHSAKLIAALGRPAQAL